MTDKEAMKRALDALETLMIERGSIYEKAITALKERLADPMREVQRLGQEIEQEPVVGTKTWFEDGKVITQYLHPSDIYIDPPQRTEQEPVPTLEDLEQEIYQNTRNFVSRDVMEWMLRRYYTHPPQRTEPTCPECKAVVLYECVACSSNNYPPKETT